MTAPNVINRTTPTEEVDAYFTAAQVADFTISPPVMIILRNLQTQLTAAEARIAALENS